MFSNLISTMKKNEAGSELISTIKRENAESELISTIKRENAESELIVALLRDFRQMKHVECIINKKTGICSRHGLDWTDLHIQNRVCLEILQDPVIVRFAPSLNYFRKFLRTYLDEIEIKGQETSEDLLNFYFNILEQVKKGPSQYSIIENNLQFYNTFEVLDHLLHCRLSLFKTPVGLVPWNGGFFLSEFILANPDIFEGKTVLELGSGVGLTGTVLYKFSRPKTIIFTDYLPEILENLFHNIKINNLLDTQPEHLECDGDDDSDSYQKNVQDLESTYQLKPIEVFHMNWEEFSHPDVVLPSFFKDLDVIIAADCVYDSPLNALFTSTLSKLLILNAQRAKAYVCSTIRNPPTYEDFIQKLHKQNLNVNVITTTAAIRQVFEYDRMDVTLLELSLKDSLFNKLFHSVKKT